MKVFVFSIKKHLHRGLGVMLLACWYAVFGCVNTTEPPFIKAQVLDVYNNKTEIDNAQILYWWEERGETVFLEPHELKAKELIAKVIEVLPNNPAAVTVKTCRISLPDITRIESSISGTGKKIMVYTAAGTVFEVLPEFPDGLRTDPEAGIADYKRYIIGSTQSHSGRLDFRLDMDFLKQIVITGVDRDT